ERAAEAAALARAQRLRGAALKGTGLTAAGPTETRPTERRPTGAGFALPAGTPHGPTARPEIWPEIRPEIVREGSRRRRAWPFLPVFASALALAVALGGWTHLDRLSAARTEASEELRRLRLAARPAVAHEARRRALLEALAGLSHRAGNGGRGIDIVEALAAALPDDAWLEAVTIEATEVRLRGRAADPAIALRALGASDVFTEARFAAPVMAEAGSALSRFELLLGRPGRAPDGASQ
ncbi:MAG: PilN domain-containing protein, partial [Paracoccaceae bacterium]